MKNKKPQTSKIDPWFGLLADRCKTDPYAKFWQQKTTGRIRVRRGREKAVS